MGYNVIGNDVRECRKSLVLDNQQPSRFTAEGSQTMYEAIQFAKYLDKTS